MGKFIINNRLYTDWQLQIYNVYNDIIVSMMTARFFFVDLRVCVCLSAHLQHNRVDSKTELLFRNVIDGKCKTPSENNQNILFEFLICVRKYGASRYLPIAIWKYLHGLIRSKASAFRNSGAREHGRMIVRADLLDLIIRVKWFVGPYFLVSSIISFALGVET